MHRIYLIFWIIILTRGFFKEESVPKLSILGLAIVIDDLLVFTSSNQSGMATLIIPIPINNDGLVLNGIYSRDMSNIYAKPVKGGKSQYKITEEEKKAIDRAINPFE